MKRVKPSAAAATNSRKAPQAITVARKSPDMAEIRRQITDLVGGGALEMVATTIEEVGKGHYLGMKYLFELVGLYPATSADGESASDSMAATLLRRLGLPEVPVPEQKVTKDRETPSAVSEDGLE
jgi:hypothetical protein